MNVLESNFSWNGTFTDGENKPDKIIVHHEAGKGLTVMQIHLYHQSLGWAGIGYHYYVGQDGCIYRGRKEAWRGSHCPGQNYNSIGICAEGNYQEETSMPTAQFNAIVALIQEIQGRKGKLPIYRHKDLYATDCPGQYYPFDNLKSAVINQEVYSAPKEEKDMNKIVTYLGDADLFAAVLVSQKYGCPLMKKVDFDASGLKATEVIQIGGKPDSTRFTTFKDAAALV